MVLIDEIDKADIDFPNDLLLVLEKYCFEITEVKECGMTPDAYTVDALKGADKEARQDYLPLIIITSNREKELPKPFLRRCLFHYIKFPDDTALAGIVQAHLGAEKLTALFNLALTKFWELRLNYNLRKPPGTSELLDWIRMLEREQQTGRTKKIEGELKKGRLPFLNTLIKTQADLDTLSKAHRQ